MVGRATGRPTIVRATSSLAAVSFAAESQRFHVNPMNLKTLALAALAALCSAPAVAADVDVTVHRVHCGIEPFEGASTPEWFEPRVTVSESCAVSTSVNSPQGECPPVDPSEQIHPSVRLEDDCDVVVHG